MNSALIILITISLIFVTKTAECKKFDDKNKPDWAKKDIRDFNDADMERLLEQWEVSCYISRLRNSIMFCKKLAIKMEF